TGDYRRRLQSPARSEFLAGADPDEDCPGPLAHRLPPAVGPEGILGHQGRHQHCRNHSCRGGAGPVAGGRGAKLRERDAGGLVPALLSGFLGLHISVSRRHGITARDPIYRPDTTFWPDQVFKDAVACLAVLATVLFLTMYHGAGPQGGAELGAPADGNEPYS